LPCTFSLTLFLAVGIGGDMFALYWDAAKQKVLGINGSGRSSAQLSVERLADLGYSEANRPDPYHALWVTVPGCLSNQMSKRHRCTG
jgi:gamma-glutamyltranspeptidase/glutathione hydrolase